ncbi:MAG: cbb3-type cytochrome oxidase assembly protein CcoS [Thalassotalea sp.]
MTIIYVLIPIAIILTVIGIYLFFWAVKTDQFNDLEKQGMSILFEDDNDTEAANKAQVLNENLESKDSGNAAKINSPKNKNS